MKKNKVIALALAVAGFAALAVLGSDESRTLVAWFGKAVWYIPYAALVSSAKFFVC